MVSKVKVDAIESTTGSGTIALNNQLSGMTVASLPTLTKTEMPAGCVIQVITVTDSSEMTLATTSYIDTNMSVAITPSATSSKILCFWEVQASFNTSEGKGLGTQLFRDSTGISSNIYANDIAKDNNTWGNLRGHWTHLDSPSTTSAITYKVKVKGLDANNVYVNHGNHATTLTLMEIKG
jgi:hypothetical protein